MFLATKKFLMRNFVRHQADFTLFFFRGFSGGLKGARRKMGEHIPTHDVVLSSLLLAALDINPSDN